VGLNTADVSSFSRNASILIPQQTTINPGNVTAIAAQNKIVIKWDLPADSSLKIIRIYRAGANQKASLLKDLPATVEQFEDTGIEVNIMYYYFITTVNGKNKESKPTNPVSAKVRR